MNHQQPHYLHGVGYLFGSASLSGVTVELVKHGWTVNGVATLMGAATALVMAFVSMSREMRFWLEKKDAMTAAATVAATVAAVAADRAAEVARTAAETLGVIQAQAETTTNAALLNTVQIGVNNLRLGALETAAVAPAGPASQP